MAAILNSNIGKVMLNKYLKPKMVFNNQSNFSLPETIKNFGFKISKVAAEHLLKDKTIEELMNSEFGVYAIERFIQPYVKEFLGKLTKEVDSGNFLLSVQGSHSVSQGLSLLGFSKKKHSICATIRINKFNPNVEVQFGHHTNKILELEYMSWQFIVPVFMPLTNFTLDEVPINVKLKAAFDLDERSINGSLLMNSGTLFKGTATLGVALPSWTPKLEASVLVNIGFLDAGLTMKKQGLEFAGNWTNVPEVGFHVVFNHTKDASSVVKGGTTLSEQDGGERKISVNTHGVITLEAMTEEPISKSLVNWNVTYDVIGGKGLGLDWKIGKKF